MILRGLTSWRGSCVFNEITSHGSIRANLSINRFPKKWSYSLLEPVIYDDWIKHTSDVVE